MLENAVNNDRLDRFNEIVKELKTNKVIKSNKELAKALGYNRPNTVTDIMNGRHTLQNSVVKTFCDTYNVNDKYILNGNMPKYNEDSPDVVTSVTDLINNKTLIPFYNNTETYNDIEAGLSKPKNLLNPKQQFMIVPDLYAQFSINVFANNMYPLYKPGYKLAVQKVDKDMVLFGFHYLLWFIDGQKHLCEIRKGSQQDQWLMVNHNEQFQSQEININKVTHVFIVKGHAVIQTN